MWPAFKTTKYDCGLVWYSSQLTAAEGETVNWDSHCCVLFMEGSFYVNMLICTLSLGRQAEILYMFFSLKTHFLYTAGGKLQERSIAGKVLHYVCRHCIQVPLRSWAPLNFLYCWTDCENCEGSVFLHWPLWVQSLLHFSGQPKPKLDVVCWLAITPSYVCSIALEWMLKFCTNSSSKSQQLTASVVVPYYTGCGQSMQI